MEHFQAGLVNDKVANRLVEVLGIGVELMGVVRQVREATAPAVEDRGIQYQFGRKKVGLTRS